MISKLRAAGRSDLFRNNLVFFVGSTVVGVLNYLLYPVISRLLSVQEFGEVQVLINVLVQITVLTNVVALFVVNIATNMKGIAPIRRFLANLETVVVCAAIVLALITIALSPILASQLRYDSVFPFWVIGGMLILSVPISIRIGFLRSQQAFAKTSYSQILQGGLRLLFAATAAALGFGVLGVMFGVAGSMMVAIIYTVYLANTLQLNIHPLASLNALRLNKASFMQLRSHITSLKSTSHYLALVTIATFSMMFLMSIDTIAAKYFFEPEQAGLYSGVSVVARIIFFGTASIAGVLASTVKTSDPHKLNLKRFAGSFGLLVLGGGAALAVFSVWPEEFTRILVGSQYNDVAHLLPKLSLALFGISVMNMFVTYHVAQRDLYMTAIAPLAAITAGAMMAVNNANPEQLADGFVYGTGVGLAIMVLWSVYWHSTKTRAAHHA